MGKVWRAHHVALNRDDALKVLPEAFASDPDRLARFRREAQVLASLNHPNIAHVYGFEHADGVQALVMELVEGPTLADRIAQGPIPVDEALPIARQIAEALEAAHEQGIIHRALKPANVKVRVDGAVKVLDFGLAKALDSAPALDASQSPTISSPVLLSGVGVLLGTAAYMSPEQAKGRPADKRSDIWAFGCVLYEMLSGKRPFEGEEVTETLASVLAREPDWTALESAPRQLRSLLQRCLQKDRRKRVGDIAAALFVLDESQSREVIAPRTGVAVVRRAAPYILATLVGITAATVAWMLKPLPPPLSRPAARFVVETAADGQFGATGRHLVAISPQGTHLVYSTEQRLYLRPLSQLDASPIRGTEPQPGRVIGNTANGVAAGREPFFSPDGQWIGFWQDGELKKVSLAGGPPVTICSTQIPWGASWAADNTILYGRGPAGIWRVTASGGEPENLVKVKPGQVALSPQMLPGGRAVIFTLAEGENWNDAQIVVHLLNSGTLKALVKGGSDARYVASGHLVYARQDSLLAVPFDAETLTVTGGPVPLLEGVARANQTANGIAHFSVSTDGTLVYVPGSAVAATNSQRTLVWVDRQGREEPIKVPPRAYDYPRLSPDGAHVALEIREADTSSNIWILDLGRLTLTPLTFLPTGGRAPMWTADGRHILFNAGGLAAGGNLFWRAADGSGDTERLLDSTTGDFATATTPDGAGVIISKNSATSADVTMLRLDPRHIGAASSLDGESPRGSTAQVRPLVHTQFSERNGVVSPDGRWLVYESNASGRLEIYVRPFPQVDSGQWLISTNGGSRPLWSRDGRELFYLSEDGTLMSVPVEQASAWRAGIPRQVLQTAYFPAAALGFNYRPYDISPDGTRFLMIKQLAEAKPRPGQRGIIVVTNWLDELKRLVPANK